MTEAWEPQIEPRARPVATGFPVGMTIAVAIAFAILIGLGVWQLQRLKWKEVLLAHLVELHLAKPQALEYALDAIAEGRDADFTRVSIVCPGIASAPYLEMYDLRDGQTGKRLISACPVDRAGHGYRSILIDRGFVPDTTPARPQTDPGDHTPIEVVGVLRKGDKGNLFTPANTPGHWYIRNVALMAKALNAPGPAPMFLFAESRTNPGVAALRPAPLPLDIPNNHFQYALTWFGLAGALVGVYAAALFRRMRG